MKVFALSVVLAPPKGSAVILSTSTDLSSFSFYQRGSVQEFMTFCAS
jgi:synaptobrevin family protein YKT6